jgi:glycogen debranching enzyme
MAYQQPWLHDLTVVLSAPTAVLSGGDGQIRSGGVQGVLHADVRVLGRAELRVDGVEPVAIAGGLEPGSAASARFTGIARTLGDGKADPTVRVERLRRVGRGRVDEEIRIVSFASVPVDTEAVLSLAADLSVIEHVKGGRADASVDVGVREGEPVLRWGSADVVVSVRAEGEGARAVPGAGDAAELRWPVRLPPRGTCTLRWSLAAEVRGAPVDAAPDPSTYWSDVAITCDDRRLPALAERSFADLRGLLLTPADRPGDVFAAAGAPWFFTLFGRDSIWTARLLLPFGWELAAGTLRALADHQGTKNDPETMEAPGKIPHELRRAAALHTQPALDGEPMSLPPLYYGTVDATPLWICLLHDAWRAGMPEVQVRALLPRLRAALRWVIEDGDEDGDGFLEYLDRSGRGLSNQGWKDSFDAVRFRDGSLAHGPVALCEAQGYAHEAALSGAALLDAFGEDAAEAEEDTSALRAWAARLAERFNAEFWVEDADGPYPALALDGGKRPVDALTSNIGHLLGTGLLDEEQSARVVARLTAPGLSSGFGLRTMDSREGGYSPLGYHCGTVWPHDTAIAIWAMTRAGFAHRATGLVEGLLAAAARFDARLPELYSGDGPEEGLGAAPYPAACRPQAWAAAAVGAIVNCLLGLRPDLPSGELRVSPVDDRRFGRLRIRGLAAGDARFGVSVAADGDARLLEAPQTVRLDFKI